MEHMPRYLAFLRSQGLPDTTNKRDYTGYVKFIRKQKHLFLRTIGKEKLGGELDHKRFEKYLHEKFPQGCKPTGQQPIEFHQPAPMASESAAEGFF